MARESYADVRQGFVENSGHCLAEEIPVEFVKKVLGFVEG
jgi:hypothetical protein